ncbi:chemotaxis protein [Sulfurospirillum sp. 1612]|uniref:chemotaxis protein n=1 Tax=Sulfurospirillum sp. 1612 TaxID=3094835 RepID=UPI002F95E4A9
MTQEELDALMAGGLEDFENDMTEATPPASSPNEEEQEQEHDHCGAESYKMDANKSWPPPPPTQEHKMVSQLDDVTKDSEKKATEIFDKLESMSEVLTQMHADFSLVSPLLESNMALFEKLIDKFPNISQFGTARDNTQQVQEIIKTLVNHTQKAEDDIINVMDIMQYQDIHRQKIERVINVMRALSKYISLLFEGSIDDTKRVGSAVHIAGDESTDDLVTSEDIEAIIESLGKKK